MSTCDRPALTHSQISRKDNEHSLSPGKTCSSATRYSIQSTSSDGENRVIEIEIEIGTGIGIGLELDWNWN